MAKRVTELDDYGRPVTYSATRSRRKSETEFPWTPGPRTWLQRRKRDLIG